MRSSRFIASGAIVLCVLTIGTSGTLWFAAQTLAENRESLQADAPKETVSFYDDVRQLNKAAEFVLDLNERHWLPSSVLIEIAKLQPDGITLNTLQITAEKNELLLRGAALNRETLLMFEKQLSESVYFSNVELPLHAITQKTDIDFTLSATINIDLAR